MLGRIVFNKIYFFIGFCCMICVFFFYIAKFIGFVFLQSRGVLKGVWRCSIATSFIVSFNHISDKL